MGAIHVLLVTVITAAPLLGGCHDRAIVVEETPVKIISERPGSGRTAREGDVVNVSYVVETTEGRELLRDDEFRFVIGGGSTIVGFDEGVRGMRVGGRRTVKCPPHLHWGRQGLPQASIPPNSPLIFHLELHDAAPAPPSMRR